MVPELILALDLPSAAAALRLVESIPDLRWVKVGPVLFTREGPALVAGLRARGLEVFLDLKWHDIPNTVAGAVRAGRDLGVRLATVHALGGEAMLRAAVEAAGDALQLVAVTVLTSHDGPELQAILGHEVESVEHEAGRLARHARAAGVHGVVCSPHEIPRLRPLVGDGLIVVPGIRPAGAPADDQRRTATAGEAARLGATHLVVGRPVLLAPDPAAAFRGLRDELG